MSEFRRVMDRLHWQRLRDNASDSDIHYLLALATLGNVTQIGLFLFMLLCPKVAKASTICVAVAGIITLSFANENPA